MIMWFNVVFIDENMDLSTNMLYFDEICETFRVNIWN